nr:MAG TPA: hypothetical protein [Caudoviricetes sp.]
MYCFSTNFDKIRLKKPIILLAFAKKLLYN